MGSQPGGEGDRVELAHLDAITSSEADLSYPFCAVLVRVIDWGLGTACSKAVRMLWAQKC